MLSERQVAEIENSAWFQTRWAPYALVDADLRIRAVNAAYERASAQPRDAMLGRPLFEVFPDNPADVEADGVANLADSLEKTFRRGAQHWMGVQRYDVPDRQRPGEFLYKVWMPVNSPIRDGRKTVAALHHVRDISRVVPAAASRQPFPEPAELRNAAEVLGHQFPGLPAEAVLGVLTHSHSVVMETLGAPDFERTEQLARLRLEVRAGHPARES
ncbi:PAS domain-containing protein [Mycobacterium sp. HUMS_1102779]|uniref:PAS domain-containing protein n=1 Tax=Mycobacterium sp. HUMS_1102779 TaxID=3383487 RepID=UPI00389A3983